MAGFVNPDPIFQVLLGYRSAAALRAAIDFDCFSAIADGRRTAARIAASRGGTERSIRILLDAIAVTAPHILRKSGPRYALTPLSRRYLVRTRPEFIGRYVSLHGHRALWDAFQRLPEAVAAGTSVVRDAHAKGPPFWEDFARATSQDSPKKASEMIRLLGRLPRPCEVLDVACGSGGYGATFARRVPGARVTLFDQPYVLRTTRKLVREKVRFLGGDLFRTPFGGPYDVVVASHVFHHFDRKECAALARKIARALKPGGRLVIQDFIPDEARKKKAQPLVFAVTMLVWTRAGDAYVAGDYRRWLRDVGLRKIRHHALNLPGDLIVATK